MAVVIVVSGSPPCVRGRALAWTSPRHADTVHPRAYGEEADTGSHLPAADGSPPCVRGRERFRRGPDQFHRFTPVRTGKRCATRPAACTRPVHPRAYGEETAPCRGPSFRFGSPPCVRGRGGRGRRAGGRQGSPPCVRGRAAGDSLARRSSRFTPVRTGKSHCVDAATLAMTVHPRAYGEEDNEAVALAEDRGSPPCVRGRGMQR